MFRIDSLEAKLHGTRDIHERLCESLADLRPRELLLSAVLGGLQVANAHEEFLPGSQEPCALIRVGDEEGRDDAEEDGDNAEPDVDVLPAGKAEVTVKLDETGACETRLSVYDFRQEQAGEITTHR